MNLHIKRKYPKRYRKHSISKHHSTVTNCNNSLRFDSDQTINDLLKTWIEINSLKHKQSTEAKYQYLIERHIIPELGNVRLCDITEQRLNTFLIDKLHHGGLKKGDKLAPAYVRTMMVILNSAMQMAFKEGMEKLIKAKIIFPSFNQKPKILSVQEQRILEKHILDQPTSIGIGVLLALRMGLRVGEICALSWKDVDFMNKVLHVCATVVRDTANNSFKIDKPKTKSSDRYIPLSSMIENILLCYQHNDQAFIISGKMDFMRPNSFEYYYHQLLNAAGIKDIRFHALRHTFATRCIEAGVDDKTLSELLGHSNVNITLNTYVHSSLSLKKKQLNKLSDYLDDSLNNMN